MSEDLDGLDPATRMVIVWDASQLTPATRAAAPALCDFAARGGRIVVLGTRQWDWKALCDVTVGEAGPYSRVFPHAGTDHPMLDRIPPEWLRRWNGLPGSVAVAPLAGPGVEAGRPLLWAVEPKTTIAAEVRAASGDGRILFCQLDVRSKAPLDASPRDPVAERVLVNLLAW